MKRKRYMTIEQVEQALARWIRRMNRAAHMVAQLQAKRRRFLVQPATKSVPKPTGEPLLESVPKVMRDLQTSDLTIPTFLQRPKQVSIDREEVERKLAEVFNGRDAMIADGKAKDEAVKAEILAEQEAIKKQKKAAGKERSKAKLRGDMRKMPLQGKDALRAIRGE